MSLCKVLLCISVAIFVFLVSLYITMAILLKTPENVICPDIRGKPIEEAKAIAERHGLSISILRYERRDNIPYNHITIQRPEPNIAIKKGRTIMVILSEGPQLVQVPFFEGHLIEGAKEQLKKNHLEIEKIIYVPAQEPGKVIAQIPEGGTELLEGQSVVLFVGTEDYDYYLMPDLRGLSVNKISEEMDRRHLRYKIQYISDEFAANRPMISLSIPPMTIFRADKEIEIRVIIGGYR